MSLNPMSSEIAKAFLSFRRFILSKNFLVQYLVSILTGISNLLSLTFFGKFFHDPGTYSSVATVLSTFTSYFVFLELGYNAEITRDFQNKTFDHSNIKTEAFGFLSLLYFRLLLTVLLVFAAFFQGFFSGLGRNGALVFGIFSLSFFVYSWLATLDSYYWATGEPSKSTSVKIVRIFVAILLPILVYVLPTQNLLRIFSSYTFLVVILGAGVSFFHIASIKKMFSLGWLPKRDYFKSFCLRCIKSAATPSLSLVGVLLMQTMLFNVHGMENLGSYVAAISLLSPITIALQTICQLVLKDLTFFTNNDRPSVKKHIKKTNTLICLIGALGIVMVLAAYELGMVGIFLKHLDSSFIWIWIALGIHNILLAMQVQHLNFLQLLQRYRTIFKTSFMLFVGTSLLVGYCTVTQGLTGYLWSMVLSSLLSFLLIRRISTQEVVMSDSRN